MNQTAVASLTGVQQKTYSDYEIGKTRIPVESLIVLARFYNVNMDYITGVSDERKPFPKKLKPSPSPEGRCSRSGGTQAAARRGGRGSPVRQDVDIKNKRRPNACACLYLNESANYKRGTSCGPVPLSLRHS